MLRVAHGANRLQTEEIVDKMIGQSVGADNGPTVSVIIPVRNEEQHIARCLESVVQQDYPKDLMEVLVVDGMSGDSSREIVSTFSNRYPFIRLLRNPKQVTAAALNKGISQSKGQLILRVDAHCFIEPDYIRLCLRTLEETGADNVGGVVIPIGTSLMQEAIGFALSSFFGIGSGRFYHCDAGMFIDTVSFGAYRREVFERIGLYDEDALFGEDDDLNYRLTRSGGRIYLSPKIRSRYYPRSSLSTLWKQYYNFGRGKVHTMRKHGRPLALRHLIPPVFVMSVVGSLALYPIRPLFGCFFAGICGSYVILAILSSAKISRREGLKYLPVMLVVFPTMHLSYGLGFLMGILRVWLPRRSRGVQ